MATTVLPKGKLPILAGFGNPLLDISVTVQDLSIYEKFNLLSNGQKEVESSDLQSLYDYFKKEKYEFQMSPGGCAQNTLRVFQWIVKAPRNSVIFGGIGADEHGSLLKDKVERDGVTTKYQKVTGQPTGKCLAIVNGTDRSLVAHLGAADIYAVTDFLKPENIEFFKTLRVAYIEAFFLTHSYPVVLEVVKLCKANDVAVTFNISGVYLFKNNYKEILHMINVADIVIGNASEFKEFSKYYEAGKPLPDLESILMQLQIDAARSGLTDRCTSLKRLPVFCKDKVEKVVICTQASEAVLCVYRRKELLRVEPDNIERSRIKDTTGAGDSFVGGFLAGVLCDNNICESIKLGCWAAGQIIQQTGCTLPTNK